MPSGKDGRRRHHHEESEEHGNHEAWVIPYADMLTLLMGLFLVMWAIGNQDLAKMQEFTRSFGAEVGLTSPAATAGSGGDGVLDGADTATTVPPDPSAAAQDALEREQAASEARAAEVRDMEHARSVITTATEAAGLGGAVSFRTEERGLVVSIVSDDVLFAPGSAELGGEGPAVLDTVAAALAQLPNPIAIEGHTDDRPISTGRYPSNWELSTARAAAVLRYLVDHHGLSGDRLVAGGYADRRPLESNTTDAGRARNRRVDIAVLATTTDPTADPSAPGPADAGGPP